MVSGIKICRNVKKKTRNLSIHLYTITRDLMVQCYRRYFHVYPAFITLISNISNLRTYSNTMDPPLSERRKKRDLTFKELTVLHITNQSWGIYRHTEEACYHLTGLSRSFDLYAYPSLPGGSRRQTK